MFDHHRSVDWFDAHTAGLSAESVWRWWCQNRVIELDGESAERFFAGI